MAKTSRVERLKSGIIVVRDCIVNYDQTPAEAVKGLPHNNDLIASSYPLACWNGGKSGIVEGATIPLFFPGRVFTTAEGREGLAAQSIGYGVPADLTPLKDEEVRQDLAEMGIWWVGAFDKDDESLWLGSNRRRRVVYLYLNPHCLGFNLSYPDLDWNDLDAVAGSPQVS